MAPIPGVELVRLDFLDVHAPDVIKSLLAGSADVVLSDMAANTTGHRKTDHLKIMALAEAAAEFAAGSLRGGRDVSMQGAAGRHRDGIARSAQRDFAVVKHVKPAASRGDSAELYLLATGFRGGRATASRVSE